MTRKKSLKLLLLCMALMLFAAACNLAPSSPADIANQTGTGVQLCNGGADSGVLIPPTNLRTLPSLATAQSYFPAVTAVVQVTGDISQFDLNANTMYWFTPGVHQINHQIFAGAHDAFVGGWDSTNGGAVIRGGVGEGPGTPATDIGDYSFTNGTSQGTDHVTIEYLRVTNYPGKTDAGVINQNSAPDWTVRFNTLDRNKFGGMMLGATNEVIQQNCFQLNGQYACNCVQNDAAINASGAPYHGLVFDHNEVDTPDAATLPAWTDGTNSFAAGCTGCGYDNYPTPTTTASCTAISQCGQDNDNGASGGLKLWNTADAKVTSNWIHGSHGAGIWADGNNVGMKIDGNYIEGSWAEGVFYEISWNPTITNNTLKNNAIIRGGVLSGASGVPGSFPEAAIYVSESGWDARADSLCPNNCGSATVGQIAGNVLTDNWGGATIWESSDRYCGTFQCGFDTANGKRMYNGVTGATPTGCTNSAPTGIESSWDCRWNAQNLNVTNNQFSFTRTNVDTFRTTLASAGDRANGFAPYTFFNVACTQGHYCGQNSTISQSSSTSYWPGDTVGCAITWGGRAGSGGGFDRAQGSTTPSINFHANTYTGDWHFDAVEANQSGSGGTLTFTQWQATTGSAGHCVFNTNTEDHPAQDSGSTITP